MHRSLEPIEKKKLKNLSTYDELESLSKDLRDNEDQITADYKICWNHAERIVTAITKDFENLMGINCHVTRIGFVIGDEYYRQSASGCLMTIKTELDNEFELSVECLIDFERVMLQVKQSAETKEVERIAKRIIKQYDNELKAELDKIKM